MVGQHQNDHFDMPLQSMQKGQKVGFRVWLPLVLKVSLMIQKSKMTIACMVLFFFFFLIFFHSVSIILGLVLFANNHNKST